MFLKRLLYSILGLRRNKDLASDLNKINLKKIILFFIILNIFFIGITIVIIKTILFIYE
ncbi:MAG: hypothetical protein NT02SARS_1057 [SAR86 cluster bacterium SAR86B]|uniref:DUF2970 domain-containing protein n=1 Tax=SAR86 cluster bacterium SAR86B TaxID=1123867 RepID=J5KIX3_9GAMM|nr:MAG: hypothetical protein NT02SARS_1057 [SAR86 cluster bacterium SAR86B]